jgi:hypothetical protein
MAKRGMAMGAVNKLNIGAGRKAGLSLNGKGLGTSPFSQSSSGASKSVRKVNSEIKSKLAKRKKKGMLNMGMQTGKRKPGMQTNKEQTIPTISKEQRRVMETQRAKKRLGRRLSNYSFVPTISVGLIEFKKEEEKKKKRDLSKITGMAQIGAGATIGQQAIRSGLPRAVGVRLEQHGTSRAAAKNIIKEGYLDPSYGGSTGGVTASMKLPKEFLERAKGHTFLSGKNPSHPFWQERNRLSPVWDVVNRKIQVLGYRGSKAGKITDADIERGSRHISGIVSQMLRPIEKNLKDLTPESYLAKVRAGTNFSDPNDVRYLESLENDPKRLREAVDYYRDDFLNLSKQIKKMGKRGYNDAARVERIRRIQKRANMLFKPYQDEFKTRIEPIKSKGNWIHNSEGKPLVSLTYKEELRDFLREKANAGDKRAAQILGLQSGLDDQLRSQRAAKMIGLTAGWTEKLVKSPALGAAGVGRTLYIPGTDAFFNDTSRFVYDPDDPFGNPLKMGKAMESELGGFGGNALKTKQKVRAFGNRAAASKWLLEQEGDGNIFKGAGKLMKANPGRVGAGLALLAGGGLASGALIGKGVSNIRKKPEVTVESDGKVKSHFRKLKNKMIRVKSFIRGERNEKR